MSGTQVLKKVGQYKLIRKIGKGATAQVYEGRKQGDYQIYAVKMMRLKEMSEAQRQMITKQISIIKSISHPNIVKLCDTLQTSNNYYLIFEFCQKGDLQKYLRQYYGSLIPEDTVQKIFFCIGDAIRQIHSKGIVHRDIKLANILLKRDGMIKLADFGFARQINTQDVMMQTYCGTPITMAPEILQNKSYDKKCDIWSLGVIMFQLVYGKLPFPINQGYSKFIEKVVNQPLHIPSQPQMPQQFKDLLQKCLQKQPENRCDIQEFMQSKWVLLGQGKKLQQKRKEKLADISQLLRNISTQDKQVTMQHDSLQKILALRLYKFIEQQIKKIMSKHIEVRKQIEELILKDPNEKDMMKVLHFLDNKYIQFLKKMSIGLIKQANQIPIKIMEIKDILVAMPSPLNEQILKEKPPGVADLLIQFLKRHSIKQQQSNEKKRQNYQLIMKFLELMHRFDLNITLVFANRYYHPQISLDHVLKHIKNRELDDPIQQIQDLFDLNANFITLSMECKQKSDKMKQYREGLRNSCSKAIDEITKKMQGYY